jgi:transcriptional regulator with XRE-family HTH domain
LKNAYITGAITIEAKDLVRSDNDIDVRIGERIRTLRTHVGLSQTELASQLDIVFQQLQKHEKGTSRVPASRLYDIARALNTPISYFFEEDERTSSKQSKQSPRSLDVSALIGAQKGKLAKQVRELVAAFMSIKDEEARADILSLVIKLSKLRTKL